jgi:hypothetical protein
MDELNTAAEYRAFLAVKPTWKDYIFAANCLDINSNGKPTEVKRRVILAIDALECAENMVESIRTAARRRKF